MLTSEPTTTTATAPITLCQRNAMLVYLNVQATDAMPAINPMNAPLDVARGKPIARMNTPRIDP